MNLNSLFLLIYLTVNSCNSSKSEENIVKSSHKEHTCKKYDVSYHLQGRIRSIETLHGVPFKVEIIKLKNNITSKEIHLKIISSSEFELSYEIEGKTIIDKGFFNSENENDDIKYKMNFIEMSPEYLEQVKQSNFFFVIHCV